MVLNVVRFEKMKKKMKKIINKEAPAR